MVQTTNNIARIAVCGRVHRVILSMFRPRRIGPIGRALLPPEVIVVKPIGFLSNKSGVNGIIWTRRAAVMPAVVVLADDATVIGVADNVALIPLGASILVTVVAESLLNRVINILDAEIA